MSVNCAHSAVIRCIHTGSTVGNPLYKTEMLASPTFIVLSFITLNELDMPNRNFK